MLRRHVRQFCLALGLAALAAAPLRAEVRDETMEAPVVMGLMAAGVRAEALGVLHGAETRYCAAARLGNSEAQYRLGRLYLTRKGLGVPAGAAMNLIAAAAQAPSTRERIIWDSTSIPKARALLRNKAALKSLLF